MTHIDLFSGIGGFALAARWTWEDYENIGHSEIDEFACSRYHRHFPGSRCWGSITGIEWEGKRADLLTGGFPCQPHSQAGLRKASEDERDLWDECIRAIRGIRPKYALFENVSGLLTSERGGFFNRVLADLAASGYDAEWEVISACAVGAPHTRERVWILAYPAQELCDTSRDEERISLQGLHTEEWTTAPHGTFEIDGHRYGSIPPNMRMGDGLPSGLDDCGALGNAIVPQVAELIFKRIRQVEWSKHYA